MAVTRDDIQDATGRRTYLAGVGWLRAFGRTSEPTPTDGQPGFAPGCTWQNPYASVVGTYFYINKGTKTSSNWLNVT